jgi:hypothetical protein
MLAEYEGGESVLILGSANYTRRNLQDLNLETNVAVRGARDTQAIRDAKTYMDLVWNNGPQRHFSTDYEQYADESLRKKFLYKVEERTGFSTF